jgi:XTP/dITP diphosphohydrolase
MNTILLATRNKNKIKEISEILLDLNLEIKSLLDYPEMPEVVENGSTFEENALKKAREVYLYMRLPVLSDDSGLEVFALGMQPGIYSARYAGFPTDYKKNNLKLISEINLISEDKRQARFRCVVAFKGTIVEETREGICYGKIIQEPRGTGGFGYDPLFVPEGYNRTFAELLAEEKNRISHRAKALLGVKATISKYFR